MQSVKDSFYEMLRGRLSALNPERTITVRGVTRPGVLVDENETESLAPLPDCFHLRWRELGVVLPETNPMLQLRCEIVYCTAGTPMNSGLDRGRCLAAMDTELLMAVMQAPQNTPQVDFSALASGGPVVSTGMRCWWGDPQFGEAKVERDRLMRVAKVDVMGWQEAAG